MEYSKNLPGVFADGHDVLKMSSIADVPHPFSRATLWWGPCLEECCLKVTGLNAMAAPNQG